MAQTTASRPTTARRKAAGTKVAATSRATTAARKAAGTKAATTRRANTTRRKASGNKAAATRARRVTTARAQSTATTTSTIAKNRIEQVQEIAERALLIPVGAVLVARDRVSTSLTDLRASYGTRAGAERELKRFERRGSTARTRVEREVKRTRTRVERQLRTNRTRLEREVRSARRDITKNVGPQVDLVTAQVENAVAAGQKVVSQAAERVTA